MSKAAKAYASVYRYLSGVPPRVRPWGFQWLPVRYLYRDLRELCPNLQGRVLDVGCGLKPYRVWCGPGVTEYVGIDLANGPEVDLLIDPAKPWPLPSCSFDAVLCTQVLEHVQDLDLATSEILRVLRPGGLLLASAPFAYSEHGSPFDFRRFSYFGLKEIFKNDYEILECRREGGVGSTVGTLMLNWIDDILDASRTTRIIKAAILPVWLVFCFVVNLIAIMLDGVDSTEHFYGNVLIYARKKGNPKA